MASLFDSFLVDSYDIISVTSNTGRYNKAEKDFPTLLEFNNYLEEVEDISELNGIPLSLCGMDPMSDLQCFQFMHFLSY